MPVVKSVTKETCWVIVSGITELETVQCSVVFSQWKVYAGAAKQLNTLTHSKPEAIEGMSVDAIQLANQSDGKLHHDSYLGMLPFFVLKEHKAGFLWLLHRSRSVLVAC